MNKPSDHTHARSPDMDGMAQKVCASQTSKNGGVSAVTEPTRIGSNHSRRDLAGAPTMTGTTPRLERIDDLTWSIKSIRGSAQSNAWMIEDGTLIASNGVQFTILVVKQSIGCERKVSAMADITEATSCSLCGEASHGRACGDMECPRRESVTVEGDVNPLPEYFRLLLEASQASEAVDRFDLRSDDTDSVIIFRTLRKESLQATLALLDYSETHNEAIKRWLTGTQNDESRQ